MYIILYYIISIITKEILSARYIDLSIIGFIIFQILGYVNICAFQVYYMYYQTVDRTRISGTTVE